MSFNSMMGSLNHTVAEAFKEDDPVIWFNAPARMLNGIFDSRHYELEHDGEITTSELITTLAVIADPDDPIDAGETLKVRGTTYRVKDLRPDNQGMTVLALELTT